MYSNDPIRFRKEKRQGRDAILFMINSISILVWLLLVSALLSLQNAMPQKTTFFERMTQVTRTGKPDGGMMTLAFVLMLTLAVVSVLGILLNTRRLKRQGDRIRLSLILNLFIGIVGTLAVIWLM